MELLADSVFVSDILAQCFVSVRHAEKKHANEDGADCEESESEKRRIPDRVISETDLMDSFPFRGPLLLSWMMPTLRPPIPSGRIDLIP